MRATRPAGLRYRQSLTRWLFARGARKIVIHRLVFDAPSTGGEPTNIRDEIVFAQGR